jgi:hypothetical protein
MVTAMMLDSMVVPQSACLLMKPVAGWSQFGTTGILAAFGRHFVMGAKSVKIEVI